MRLGHDPDALFSPRTDRQATRRLARALLAQAMGELDHYVREDGARVNPNRWKPLAARESLQLHRERECVRPDGSSRALLVAGRVRGRVEHALFAAASESLEQMALLHAFLFGDAVSSSAVVASLEPPASTYVSDGKPRRDDWLLDACSLSIKSLLKRGKTPGEDMSVQFLEYSGFTRCDHSGELVGFFLLSPSAEHPTEPTVRCLFRQLHNDVMDVFLVASGDVSRASASGRSSARAVGSATSAWASLVTMDVLFNMANLLDCAETKRLTIMMRERRQAVRSKKQTDDPEVIAMLESAAAKKRSACGVCQRKKTLFHSFTSCDVCAQTVCTHCRLRRRVFVPRFDAHGAGTSGGFFQKIAACKPCAVLAATGVSTSSGRQSRALSIKPPSSSQYHELTEEVHESLRAKRRTRGKAERFRIQSTATPRAFDRRKRTDSNSSAASLPTPLGSKQTPRGGVLLFSPLNGDARARKVSSASDTGGHWSSITPRNVDKKLQQQQQQQSRFPRFATGFNAATTPKSTRSKRAPKGFSTRTDDTDSGCPEAPSVGYASHSLPSTPSSASTQSWSTSASSTAKPSPSDLMQRMLELRQLAEITYDTARRNNDMMPSTQHRSGRFQEAP